MGKVRVDMAMSLDGYIAGPNDGPEAPLGQGGERLHTWMFKIASWRERQGLPGGETGIDSDLIEETFVNTGVYVMGRRMFDLGVDHWGENPPFRAPVFVLTHRPREPLIKEGGTTFTFVTDGIASAVEQARAVAGDLDVRVSGGASVVQQALRAGLVDAIQLHLAPVLFGSGTPLFHDIGPDRIELECTRIVDSPGVTHLRFRVVK